MIKEKKSQEAPLIGIATEKLSLPAMLILISQKPAHGYELIQELNKYSFIEGEMEPATVYRYLRKMEELGFVNSHWDTGNYGPARRLYEITSEGMEQLRVWSDLLKKRKEKLEELLKLFNEMISFE